MKKIVIIGPESTGKSTLCAQLAQHYQTDWVREYAREYLLTHGTDYRVEDLWTIACGQRKAEDELLEKLRLEKGSDPVCIIDTDFSVLKVWSEYVFNRCDNRILTEICNRNYDLYLLCNTDLPWVKDELREYPDLETREKLFHYYKDYLVNQTLPWHIVSGTQGARLNSATNFIDEVLFSH